MLSGCAGCHHSLVGDWAPATPAAGAGLGLSVVKGRPAAVLAGGVTCFY